MSTWSKRPAVVDCFRLLQIAAYCCKRPPASSRMAEVRGSRLTHCPTRLFAVGLNRARPYGNADDPELERIEVLPRERLMSREGEQQLIALAHYTDGTIRDVTRMTQFESNDPDLAEVSETGLVRTSTATGSVAVMTRFQSHVDVFRATIPLGLEVDQLPPSKSYIDELVFGKLERLGLPRVQAFRRLDLFAPGND